MTMPADHRERTPARLHDRAVDEIAFIRDTMSRAASFTAVPGTGGVAMGLTAIVAALVAARQLTPRTWLAVWLAEAALAVAIGVAAMVRKSRAAGEPLFSGRGRQFVFAFAPAIVVGAAVTPLLYDAGLVDRLPAVWLLLYGTAVVAGGSHAVPVVPLMGLAFLGLGLGALIAPAGWGDAFMAGGFGGLHVAFGIIIARRYGG